MEKQYWVVAPPRKFSDGYSRASVSGPWELERALLQMRDGDILCAPVETESYQQEERRTTIKYRLK